MHQCRKKKTLFLVATSFTISVYKKTLVCVPSNHYTTDCPMLLQKPGRLLALAFYVIYRNLLPSTITCFFLNTKKVEPPSFLLRKIFQWRWMRWRSATFLSCCLCLLEPWLVWPAADAVVVLLFNCIATRRFTCLLSTLANDNAAEYLFEPTHHIGVAKNWILFSTFFGKIFISALGPN